MASPTLALCKALIARPSLTPDDAGCQALIADYLAPQGFVPEALPFGEVRNLWLRRGTQGPLFVFAGHTDVVPTGDVSQWRFPPFEPTEHQGMLYGRGAADMKAGVAAFTVACQEFVQEHPDHRGSIALLITSDEEGPSVNGTVKVCEVLKARGELPDYCVIGEPSSAQQLGDILRNGRRGSLTGVLTIQGKQGHVAYPDKVVNPIHLAAPVVAALSSTVWDRGNAYFPATSFQVASFQSGTGASNVVPGTAEIVFNFRFCTESSPESLKARVQAMIDAHGVNYTLDWTLNGEPFLTPESALTQALQTAVLAETGVSAQLNTGGGTSDGRFIAKICPQVVECGPVNATIHQIDECVAIADLDRLKNIYKRTLAQLLLD